MLDFDVVVGDYDVIDIWSLLWHFFILQLCFSDTFSLQPKQLQTDYVSSHKKEYKNDL